MFQPRSSRAAALGLVLAALAPATAMAGQDLRSPDARDAATSAAPSVDLRSPDARDAAEGRSAADAPSVMVVRIPQPSHAGGGMDWGDAGIGAGAVVGLMLLALGSGLAIVHRRQGARAIG